VSMVVMLSSASMLVSEVVFFFFFPTKKIHHRRLCIRRAEINTYAKLSCTGSTGVATTFAVALTGSTFNRRKCSFHCIQPLIKYKTNAKRKAKGVTRYMFARRFLSAVIMPHRLHCAEEWHNCDCKVSVALQLPGIPLLDDGFGTQAVGSQRLSEHFLSWFVTDEDCVHLRSTQPPTQQSREDSARMSV
jgi:hypothetical protein